MNISPHKLYPYITGIVGLEGETPASIAVVAVLSPSPHYPDQGRIIVGSPPSSEAAIGSFSTGPQPAVRFAETLLAAAADVDAALDSVQPEIVTARDSEAGQRCESCCLPIRAGDQIQFFDDEDEEGNGIRVPVHAERCPGAAS